MPESGEICAGWCCKTGAGVSGVRKLFGHFAEDLLAPALDALVAQVVLVGFIQRQANKQLAIGDNRFWLVNS
jgi:hypothetical protein